MQALNSMRGIAAIIIVLFHLRSLLEGVPEMAWLSHFLAKGYLRVEPFFIISGFTLSKIYFERFSGHLSPGPMVRFYGFRLARLYPVWLLSLVVMLVWHVCYLGFDFSGKYGLRALAENLLLIQAWGTQERLTWNQPGWAMSALFAAYLVFPFVVVGLAHTGRVVHGLVAVACLAGLVALEYAFGSLDVTSDFGVLRGFFQFVLGMLLARVALPAGLLESGWLSLLQILALLLLFAAMNIDAVPDVAVVPVWSAMVFLLCGDRGVLSRAFRARWMIWLGGVSFSLYLLQYPISRFYAGHPALLQMLLDLGPKAEALARVVELLAVFLLAAWLVNAFLEAPMRRFVRAHVSRVSERWPTVSQGQQSSSV